MSIPKSETNPISALSQQRERDDHLRVQSAMAQEQQAQMQGLELFSFILALFTGMKPGEGVGAPEAIKEFAGAFNIDSSRFMKTVRSYQSCDISAFEAAKRTYKQTDISSVDMERAEKAVAKYAESGNPLLELIADKESGADYNRVYSAGVKRVNLTEMSVDQVMQWQRQYVNDGSPSSAAGKYQIIRKTLAGLKDEMNLRGDEKFTPELQDKMAVHLLNRRGYDDYLAGKISEDKFMLNVSKEWASMPKDEGGRSYYAGDGLNKAHATPATLMLAMRHTKDEYLAQKNGLTDKYNETAVASTSGAEAVAENEKDTGVEVAKNDQGTQPEDPAVVASVTEPTIGAAV